MKRILLCGLALCFSASVLRADESAALFQFNGKNYTSKDLSPALQQSNYEMQRQVYDNLQKVADEQIFEDYARAEAKKKGMTLEQYEAQTFKGKVATEKEAKAWFEENKARLGGREFESIKKDIINLLQSQESEKLRTAALEKVKANGKFKFLMAEPKAPVVEISYQGFPSKGNEKAKVHIVEFADYGCGHCKHASKALKSLTDKYKDKVQFTYLDFPLGRTETSKKVAEGGVCADKQKKFWDYHYMAFGEASLTDKSPVEFAKNLKLDMKAFEACLASPDTAKKVESAKNEGVRIGVNGTPAIFFKGRKIYGYDEKMLEDELKKLL